MMKRDGQRSIILFAHFSSSDSQWLSTVVATFPDHKIEFLVPLRA